MRAQKKRFSNNWNIPIDPSDKNYIQNEINYPHIIQGIYPSIMQRITINIMSMIAYSI